MLQPFQTAGIKYNYPNLGMALTLRCIPPTSYPKAEVFWATIAEGMRFTPIDLSDRVTQDPEGYSKIKLFHHFCLSWNLMILLDARILKT